ncbi:M1 family metallopeptidase [Streptomyces lavendulae]|uniref:M1 family metallopeptidase n=1 Tax=Streptomyces TaxID=1883 RepID=UPI0024750D2E|nr:M1 family metallopeptidase [Streptomyces sp. SPB4]MDH6545616.1 aminopeptidase N [Streptomyces sp. SPB4]
MNLSGQKAAAPDPYFPANGDPRYRVHRYELALEYRPGPNRLSGTARLSAIAGRAPLAEFALNLAEFKVGRVLVDGRVPHYAHRGGKLRIRPAKPLPAGAAFTVEVHWAGNPKPVRSPWGGLGWEELADGALVASQPVGAPSWYPCNDRPADKASYHISVNTPSAYTVVAGGRLLTRTTRASTTTWVYEQPAPTSSYLVGLSIGLYQTVLLGDPGLGGVAQTAHVPAHLLPRFSRDFARQPAMMRLFEELFGPYPFGEYAVVIADEELDVPVEAQGLSLFGANHVDGARGSERLIAHELAHQWFGNSVTIADWRHIWLNEGLAKYAEWLWSERSGGRPAHDLAAAAHRLLSAQPQDLRLADPGRKLMFDDRLYQRGGLTVHAIRCALGDTAFFRMLRDWAGVHRHGVVTTAVFTAHVARYATEPVDELLTAWLHTPELPPLPASSVAPARPPYPPHPASA